MIYGNSGGSLPQRALVQVLESVLLIVALLVLFQEHIDGGRRWLLATGFMVVYLRITVTCSTS